MPWKLSVTSQVRFRAHRQPGYRRTASQLREALAAELRKDLARASMRLSEKEAADLKAAVRVSPTGLFSYRIKANCGHLVEILLSHPVVRQCQRELVMAIGGFSNWSDSCFSL